MCYHVNIYKYLIEPHRCKLSQPQAHASPFSFNLYTTSLEKSINLNFENTNCPSNSNFLQGEFQIPAAICVKKNHHDM